MTGLDITLLMTEAEAVRYSNPLRLHAIGAQLVQLASSAGNEEAFVQGLLYQAWASHTNSHIEQSFSEGLEALRLSRRLGLLEYEGYAINTLAGNFFLCGLAKEAASLYHRQLAIGRELAHPRLMSFALHDLTLTMDDGQAADTVQLLYEALALTPQDSLERCFITGSLVVTLCILDRPAEAKELLTEVLPIAQQVGGDVLGDLYVKYVDIFLKENAPENALQAIEYAHEIPELSGTQRVIIRLAYLRYLQHIADYETFFYEAEDTYTDAFNIGLLNYGLDALNIAKEAAQHIGDNARLVQIYERIIQELPRAQQQSSDLRLNVLAAIFAENQAAAREQLHLTEQKLAILDRISHEFRTPLTVIQSAAELVDTYGEKMPLERRSKHLHTITAQVRSMTEMLENITVLLEDPEENQLPAGSSFSAQNITSSILERIGAAAMPVERIDVRADGDTTVDTALFHALSAIGYHLVHNALRYSSDTVYLKLSITPAHVDMNVQDTGIGILVDEQQAVFEPLVRGSNQHEPTGGGLGLAIVAKLVNELRAALHLTSAEQQGTTVRITVPLIQSGNN